MGMKQLQISACGRSRASDQQSKWCCLSRCPTLSSHQSGETPPFTWMSSSLELNSDTSTFSPSDTLVSDTHSRPEARRWASEGRSRSRPDFNTLTRLKEGCRGPRFLLRASFATWMTSSQHFAGKTQKPGEQNRKRALRSFESVYWQTYIFRFQPMCWVNTGNRYQESLTSSDLCQEERRKSSASRWSTVKTVREGSPTWCPRHCSLTVCSYRFIWVSSHWLEQQLSRRMIAPPAASASMFFFCSVMFHKLNTAVFSGKHTLLSILSMNAIICRMSTRSHLTPKPDMERTARH